jgi:hypothetical protein
MKIVVNLPSSHWHWMPTTRKDRTFTGIAIIEICWLGCSVAVMTDKLYHSTMCRLCVLDPQKTTEGGSHEGHDSNR